MEYLREEALQLYLVGTNKSTALKVRNMTRESVSVMTFKTNLESLLIPMVMSLLFLIGVIGNITVIYTVARHRSMHSVSNIYILNIAIGDLLMLVIALPFQATIFTLKEWVFGEITCKISEFLQPVSVGVTAFTLVVLCADRHAAWAGNLRYYLLAKTRKLNIVVNIVIIWTVALAMGVPDLVSSYIMHYPINKDLIYKVCSVFPPTWGAIYPIVHDTVGFIVLLGLSTMICLVYLLLISILICTKGYQEAISDDVHYRSESEEKSKTDGNDKRNRNKTSKRHPKGKRCREERERQKRWTRQRQNTTKVVAAMLFMFVFCCLPRYIFQLWFHFDKHPYNTLWYVMKLVGFCLTFAHSVVNPFVLCTMDGRFNEHFKRYWLYGCASAEKRIALMQQLVNTSESSDADDTETTVKTQPEIYAEVIKPSKMAPRYQTSKRPAPIYSHYPDDLPYDTVGIHRYPYVQDDPSTFAIYI